MADAPNNPNGVQGANGAIRRAGRDIPEQGS